MKKLAIVTLSLIFTLGANALDKAPCGQRVDLLKHPDKVWKNGSLINKTLADAAQQGAQYQFASIRSKLPVFSWEVQSNKEFVKETAYQILVASSPNLLEPGKADFWDSGKQDSTGAIQKGYAGKELQSATVYYWKVRTWNDLELSDWSNVQSFITADSLTDDYRASYYPLEKSDDFPLSTSNVTRNNKSVKLIDFGTDAFGSLRLTIQCPSDNNTAIVRLGEKLKDGIIDPHPGATLRFAQYSIALKKGTSTYQIEILPDKRNTSGAAVRMPVYIGEVFPFRYVEVDFNSPANLISSIRQTSHYPFDDTAEFHSDNEILNQVWEICRYSMKATSFCGIYVDGDRERIPYEADALINQLSHYAADNEYSLARISQEYLIKHPTWPTEWFMQSILLAWYDYLYTGDIRSIKLNYNDLKAKSLIALANDETGLISTRDKKQTPDILKSVYAHDTIRDIVDWPQSGGFGQSNKPGESDYFVFKEYNSVVNAYHYYTLNILQKMATALGKTDDAAFFTVRAAKVKDSFNKFFLNSEKGIYIDCIGTDHSALHSNMFPLAFGLVPEEHLQSVTDFVRSRGMACSVYGSQFLMDAIYQGELGDYGLERMIATDDRSWYNMIRLGSTITLEAWDNKYKDNLDWNHAWGAAPANIIMRHLVGVEPLEPGWGKIKVKPRIGSLKDVHAVIPSIRGNITVDIKRRVDNSVSLSVKAPADVLIYYDLHNLNK